jgi:hypothetical protein
VTDSDSRLGRNGAEEIKKHPFFDGVDWANIRKKRAPNIPQITSEISTENFDKFDEQQDSDPKAKKLFGGKRVDIDFIGYTYKADVENEKSLLVNVLKDLESVANQELEKQYTSGALILWSTQATNTGPVINQRVGVADPFSKKEVQPGVGVLST